MVEHVSPRRKLDTDWRFSTTTTTVAVSAAALSPLSPFPSFGAEPGYYPPLQWEGGKEEGGRGSGVWGKKERGRERVKCWPGGRRARAETGQGRDADGPRPER